MTRDEIMAMRPGRELDALVAEHIFPGSKDVFVPTWSDKNWPYQWDADGNEITWKPSTDISAAWESWQKVQRDHVHMSIHWMDGKYLAEIIETDPEEGYKYLSQVESASAPEAICKAALLAVMEVSE